MKSLVLLAFASGLFGAENLQVNPKLDYSRDSDNGPLLSGQRLADGPKRGAPNYILIASRTCYNSKRQARRTAGLYLQYRGRVRFVTVDIDQERPPSQQELVRQYYLGYVPHVVVLSAAGKPLYDRSGEIGIETISRILDKELSR